MTGRLTVSLTTLLIVSTAVNLEAQQATDAATRARLSTLFTAAGDTPGGKGLLPIALAEADTALAEALLAAKASNDLAAMQAHASGVIHAIDPGRQAAGPGLGYGVLRAVTEIIVQVQQIAATDPKLDAARSAPRTLTPAQQVLQSAEALIGLAQQIRRATSARDASTVTVELVRMARQVIAGTHPLPAKERQALGRGEGGLLAVHSSLAMLMMNRTGELPAARRPVR